MFAALGRLVSRRPWWVLLVWVVAAVAVIASAPKLTSTQDESAFLPSHYESIKAATLQQKAFPSAGQIAALVVFDRTDGKPLTPADQQTITSITKELSSQSFATFAHIAPGQVSPNGLVQADFVTAKEGKNPYAPEAAQDVTKLRSTLAPLVKGSDLTAGVTGPSAAAVDSQNASSRALKIVGVTTVLLILLLLVLIFRSVLVALMPILVVGLVSQVAVGLIAMANEAFGLKADSSIQVILVVVLYGIGTDYILFFLFRYRERLREGDENRDAVAHAVTRAGEAIASAGGAVIVAFMALVLSSLSIFRSIGPALAIAVAVTVLAALTLVPAVVSLLGTRVFWPSNSWRNTPEATRFRRVGTALGARPTTFAAASGGLLVVLAFFALGFHPSFNFSDTGAPKTAESTVAMQTFEKGQPSGAANPTSVLVHSTMGTAISQSDLTAYAGALAGPPASRPLA